MELPELSRRQLKFLILLWSVATILMLYIGFEMVDVSFQTTPLYGKFISSIVFMVCIILALWKLVRYINMFKEQTA